MGIEEEADRTLFIRNLDQRVSEEILFELCLQAGPLIKTKIPKDNDGKQKTFGFAVYKHDVSVPYAIQLLNGTPLFGKNISVQFRSGSSHISSPGNLQNTSPGNTPNPHGQITQVQLNSPPYTPPPQMQRSYSSPDSLQKHVVMNNMMLQLHMQQLQQLNGGFSGLPQRHQPNANAGGSISSGGSGGVRQQDNSSYWQRQINNDNNGGHNSRSQRYAEEPGSSRQQHGRDGYHHNDRRSGRHYDNSGGTGSRPYDNRGGSRGYQDGRYRRY